MVARLAEVLPAFDGEASRVRCFAHIINLVVKSILQVFEAPKGRKGRTGGAIDEGSEDEGEGPVRIEVGENIQNTEAVETLESEDDNEEGDDDKVRGWHDERATMTKEKRKGLNARVQPIKSMLGKVRHFCIVQVYLLTCHLFPQSLHFPPCCVMTLHMATLPPLNSLLPTFHRFHHHGPPPRIPHSLSHIQRHSLTSTTGPFYSFERLLTQ